MGRRIMASIPVPIGPIEWRVVPKPSGGARRVVVLDPADERAFARSVAGVAPAIERALGPGSHANRVVGWDRRRGPILEPWTRARRRWQRAVWQLGNDGKSVAVTDVRACYASMDARVVADRLRSLGADDDRVGEIVSWLHAFSELGVDGLPVGPSASAPLADVVLAAGDDVLRASGAGFVRWVDDVVILASDRRTRAAALDDLAQAWAGVGLQMHEGKTVLLDDPRDVTGWMGTTSNVPSTAAMLGDNRAT
jgi:hypothetical protein